MAEDLVAELTLTLRNEMNAGLDEVRGEFTALDTTLQGLRDVLGGLTAELAAMRAPVGLVEGFAGVDAEVKAVIGSVEGIGVAVDADIAKIQQMSAALNETHVGGAAGGGGGGGGHGLMEDAAAGASGGIASHVGGGMMSMMGDAFMGFIAVDAAKDAAQKYADFDWILTHIAITDKLSGTAATDEVSRLDKVLSTMAMQTGTSSTDLANAYSFLVTTGMSRALIDQMMPSLAETSTAYNVPVSDQAQAIYTLNHNLDIDADDMKKGLGMLADAGKIGHFGLKDFGQYLPSVGAEMGMLGAGGLHGEDVAASALEVVRGVTGDSQSAATDVGDLLTYMTSPVAMRFFDRTKRSQSLLGQPILDLFAKYHVQALDLPKYFDAEADKGIDPLDAMVDYMHAMKTQDMTPTDQMILFNSMFHNVQASKAMIGLISNYDLFHADQTALGKVSSSSVDVDYTTASATPEIALRKMDESFVQLVRTIGYDLIPTFDLLGEGMGHLVTIINGLGIIFDKATAPFTTAVGTAAAYANHWYQGVAVSPGAIPAGSVPPMLPLGVDQSKAGMTLNINVSHQGNATVTPTNVPPGVNLKVNQGTVLGAP